MHTSRAARSSESCPRNRGISWFNPGGVQKCEERATWKGQTRDNAAAVRASRLSGGAMLWCSRKLVTPFECALTKNAPVSALESALTNSLDLKPPGMNTCKKGYGYPLVASNGLS